MGLGHRGRHSWLEGWLAGRPAKKLAEDPCDYLLIPVATVPGGSFMPKLTSSRRKAWNVPSALWEESAFYCERRLSGC
jgi:hypothetical protein